VSAGGTTTPATLGASVAATRRAFRNWVRVGVVAGLASPSAIPPRAGWKRLADVPLVFRTRLGPVLRTGAGNASPIVEIFRDGEYDVDVAWDGLEWIVDVGAHVGAFTTWAAWRAPHARILAIEPEPRNFADLEANVRRNGLADRATLVNAAVAATGGERLLDVPAHRDHASLGGSAGGRSARVRTVDLAGALAAEGIERVSLLKMDCEGAEWDVLERLPDDLWPRLDRIVLEVHAGPDRRVDDMGSLLGRAGYRVETLSRTPSGVPWYETLATLWAQRA
jgi:FkbM family methyltransferase